MPGSAEKRIYGGVDPLLALIPAGRLTGEDAMVVAAYAALCDLLTFDPASGCTLHVLNGKDRRIGRTPAEALEALRADFREVSHVYSTLGDVLRERPEQLQAGVHALATAVGARERSPISSLISNRAVRRVVDEIETVAPFFRQLPKQEAI